MSLSADSSDGAIGGGADEVLVRQVAIDALPTVPPADADEWLAGTVVVLDFVRAWLRAHPTNRSAAPVAFVFPPYPNQVRQRLGGRKIRGFKYSHQSHAIQGHLYVSAETLTDVTEIEGVAVDVPTIFQFLVDKGLGDVPAVVALPSTDEAILCPLGVASEDACRTLSLKHEARGVSVASVDEKLDEFYRTWLIVPTDHTKVWDDARRFIPARRTEKLIHNYLFPFLKNAFDASHIVRSEDSTPAGRADITLLRREDRVSEGSGVIELKVLRAMRHPEAGGVAVACPITVNEDAIADGITQAISYRQKLGCELAFICMYDFRREDEQTLVEQFRDQFTQSNIESRRYFLYNNSRAYRRAQPGAVSRPRRRNSSDGDASPQPEPIRPSVTTKDKTSRKPKPLKQSRPPRDSRGKKN